MMKKRNLTILLLLIVLNGCNLVFPAPPSESADEKSALETNLVDEEIQDAGPESSLPEPEPSGSEPEKDGADVRVDMDTEGTGTEKDSVVLNPLTGLPAPYPEYLLLPPALVSVTNFPPSARPQAGLATSPIVFELYIGDGMTRYLALFYGAYPQNEMAKTSEDLEGELTAGMGAPAIGPVRSGRIPYEHIRKLYQGFIVMASAYSRVADQLQDYVNVFGDDQSDVNSAMIPVEDLEKIARSHENDLGGTPLESMVFDADASEGGQDAQSIWIYYAYKNQVFWRYNEADGSYHRWQDNADGETFIEQTDRLNGEPLAYENVILLMVDHEVEQKYLIDLDLLFVEKDKAYIFRDGEMHTAYWTTKSEEYEQTTGKLRPIRFIDAEGNPFPLKPGQTWIELIPTHSPIWETVDSDAYHVRLNGRSKGSGHWAVWFEIDY